MRGDQLSRQWRILRQIEASKYGLTAAEIAEIGGVSLKTGYRDLNDLQLAGFPLYAEKGDTGRRWKFIDTYRFDLPQPFTFTELMSLHLSRDLFKIFQGTVFYEAIESLFEKVGATLSPEALDFLERLRSACQMGIRPYKGYQGFRGIIEQVNQAVLERRRVEMAYRASMPAPRSCAVSIRTSSGFSTVPSTLSADASSGRKCALSCWTASRCCG